MTEHKWHFDKYLWAYDLPQIYEFDIILCRILWAFIWYILFCLLTLALQINTNFSSLLHRFCQEINLKMLKLRCFVSFIVVFCGVMLGGHVYNVKPLQKLQDTRWCVVYLIILKINPRKLLSKHSSSLISFQSRKALHPWYSYLSMG